MKMNALALNNLFTFFREVTVREHERNVKCQGARNFN